MFLSTAPKTSDPLMLIEGGLTVIALALPFAWPRLGSAFFSSVERPFKRLARRQRLSIAFVGVLALLLRLAILPLCPIPHPFAPNDFSFLLAANTFASGRLTNPTPAMWQHFETIHVTMKPTYMSMYFPAQGLVLAASKVLTGHPWFGVLVTAALMCAGLCWMLQAWLPPTWALLGGLLAVLRLALFSPWINTYSGAGSISAFGGALVLGSLPRLRRGVRFRDALLLAVGIVILATSRPYEGLLLCLPVAFVLGHWLISGTNLPPASVLLRRAAIPLALIVAAGAWMGYYDYRAFGNPLTPPYKVDRDTYAMAPYFIWQSSRPEPVYRDASMRRFYQKDELFYFQKIHSRSGFLPETLRKAVGALLFFTGFALLPPLIMVRRVLLDRRVRFLVICTLVLMAGVLIEIFLIPHYLAPFTAAFYALGLQAMRHLRLWKLGDQPVGRTILRLSVTICLALAVLRVYAVPLHLLPSDQPTGARSDFWYGPGPFGAARARVESNMEKLPGQQLLIVHYSNDHDAMDEWVYNAPDIDRSKVIWARDLGTAANQDLILYYKARSVWLVQPDAKPIVSPYPISETETADLK